MSASGTPAKWRMWILWAASDASTCGRPGGRGRNRQRGVPCCPTTASSFPPTQNVATGCAMPQRSQSACRGSWSRRPCCSPDVAPEAPSSPTPTPEQHRKQAHAPHLSQDLLGAALAAGAALARLASVQDHHLLEARLLCAAGQQVGRVEWPPPSAGRRPACGSGWLRPAAQTATGLSRRMQHHNVPFPAAAHLQLYHLEEAPQHSAAGGQRPAQGPMGAAVESNWPRRQAPRAGRHSGCSSTRPTSHTTLPTCSSCAAR